MTPALIPPASPAPPEPSPSPSRSRQVESRREDSQPARPFAPAVAVGACVQMRVERLGTDIRRQLLAVDAGGYGGTGLTAVHPAIVPGGRRAPRTTPRADSRRTGGRHA